eukprot:16186-Chlamydomonas_euryale.AAC.1
MKKECIHTEHYVHTHTHHRPRRRWIDCARATLRELHVLHDGEWYWRAQDRAQWRALVGAMR